MRRRILALPAAALAAVALASPTPARATAPHTPYGFTSVAAQPGPAVGEVTLSWAEDGTYTTGFRLETAITTFSPTGSSSLPRYGRGWHSLSIPSSARTLTLSADQVAALGAPVGSGNALYYRMAAVNEDPYGVTAVRNDSGLKAVLPQPQAPSRTGLGIRVASFNVRTARALTDTRSWLERAPDVAAQIVRYNPHLVAVQELGPGRADGQTGTTGGTPRQTDSLLTALAGVYGDKYKLVRTTPYVVSGTPTDTQGARILYDSSRYTLLTSCPDKTGTSSYSSSCSFELPIRSSDTEDNRRRAAYAEFQEKETGQKLWFVSAHLDARHSSTLSTEQSYNALRALQGKTIADKVAALDTNNEPAIVGGDFNSWQSNQVGNGGHDPLIDNGFYDASAAASRVNFEYTTMNDFALTLVPNNQGVGVRLDMLFLKNFRGSARFENVMDVTDSARPSDHNMIVADVVPFDPWSSMTIRTRTPVRR